MTKKLNSTLFKAKKVSKLPMLQDLTVVVYKVQNMQLTEDNITHRAAFKEVEVADHHSVVVEDLFVAVQVALLNPSTTLVHQWADAHLLVDHHVVSVVQ